MNTLLKPLIKIHNLPMKGLFELGGHPGPDNGTTPFEPPRELSETPRGLTGRVKYAADLFEAALVLRGDEWITGAVKFLAPREKKQGFGGQSADPVPATISARKFGRYSRRYLNQGYPRIGHYPPCLS